MNAHCFENPKEVLNPHVDLNTGFKHFNMVYTEVSKMQGCDISSVPHDTAAWMCVAPTQTGQTVGRRIKLWRCICGKESFYSFMV